MIAWRYLYHYRSEKSMAYYSPAIITSVSLLAVSGPEVGAIAGAVVGACMIIIKVAEHMWPSKRNGRSLSQNEHDLVMKLVQGMKSLEKAADRLSSREIDGREVLNRVDGRLASLSQKFDNLAMELSRIKEKIK